MGASVSSATQRKWVIFCATALSALAAPSARAQTGRVVTGAGYSAATGGPVIGAQIAVVGTDVATLSDADGSFVLLDVPATGAVQLRITSPGYKPENRSIAVAENDVHVGLQPTADGYTDLSETTPRPPRLTGQLGSTTVDGADLNQIPHVTLEGAMRGKIPGALIQSNSGAPGEGNQVRLRGISTLAGRKNHADVGRT